MAKVRNLSDIQQEIAFTEFDFYQRYEESFKTSELGRIKSLLPLREMAISFGLIEEKPKSLRTKRGRKSFFTPEGKVALAFLKMYTGLSAPKVRDALNGNIHYQIFCGIRISPENQLTNYKLIAKPSRWKMRWLYLLPTIARISLSVMAYRFYGRSAIMTEQRGSYGTVHRVCRNQQIGD